MASVQLHLGMIKLELKEFEEAQKHMQISFATRKEVYGIKDKRTRQAHLGVAMAARLAGNLQHAKEVLETAEDSFLGKAQPLHKFLKQTFSRLLSVAIINCIAIQWLLSNMGICNVFDTHSHMHAMGV